MQNPGVRTHKGSVDRIDGSPGSDEKGKQMKKSASCSRFLTWFTVLLLSALAAGCGGGGGEGRDPILGSPSIAATRPTVTFTAPANLATAVATNSNVTATFSRAMNPATLVSPATTFTLTGPGGAPVAGTVTYAAVGNTAIFNPTVDLAGNTQYIATITTAAADTAGNTLASNFAWTFVTGAAPDVVAPLISLTAPADTATGVEINRKITATFNEAMDPATISGTSFTLTGPGGAPVAGTVTYAAAGATVTFTPASNLANNTTYTATVANTVTDLAGNALAAGPVPNPWTFTTAAAPDTTAPRINFTNPVNLATNVSVVTKAINATFSEPMDPATISTATFTLTGPGVTPVTGTVSYDPLNNVATFAPLADLAFSTQYTATVTGATDLAGNALVSGLVPNPWTFTTAAAPVIVSPINLRTAEPYGIFGGSAGMTNMGTLTVIDGAGALTADIGTTATATSSITGFHDSNGDIYTETLANIGNVTGTIKTCAVSTTGPTSAGVNAANCAAAPQARLDAQTAYQVLEAMAPVGASPAPGGNLAGLTLLPGVYKAPAGSFAIQGGDLTLDAAGDANATWVFQMATSLTVGGPGAAFPQSIILANGAQAKNVFWQVGSAATINAGGGGTMVGTIISQAGVTFSTAGNVAIVTLNGRALSLGASVTVVNTVINVPAP